MKLRTPSFKTNLETEHTLNLVPIIDIIFTILIFFLLLYAFSKIVTIEKESEEITVPQADIAESLELENTVIVEIKDNNIYIEGKLSSIKDMRGYVIKKGKPEEVNCIIMGEQDTTYNVFTPIILELKKIGVKKVNLVTDNN